MYRENVYEIIGSIGENVTTLVVPKNSGLKGYAWKVLKEAGLKLEDAEQMRDNKLKLGDLTLILKRGEDIPQLVMDYATTKGEVVLGLTGNDLFDEFRLRVPQNPLIVENTYDWFDDGSFNGDGRGAKFYRPALCFINKTGRIDDVPLEARIALNAKYEFTSRNYITKSPKLKGRNFQEKIYYGDVELTVAEGLNDCCTDTVYSGETIDTYGLKIIEIIRFSDLVLISPLGKQKG